MYISASQMLPRASFKGKIGSVFGGTADLKFANSRGGGYEHPSPRQTILSNSITYDNIVCIDPDHVCFSIDNSIGISVDLWNIFDFGGEGR